MIKLNDKIEKVLSDLDKKREDGVYPSITREVGEYLYQLVKKHKPRRILEIGACGGYSTIWLAASASDFGSEVDTFEYSQDRGPAAVENIKKAGLENINVHLEDAKMGIPKLTAEYDFVFIDAMKKEYQIYFDLIEPKLSSRAIIVSDNILSHREALQEYVEYVKNKSDFESEINPLHSGLLITYKK